MELKCRINGKDYNTNLVQGVPISEEYNETLDSAAIVIDRVSKITNMYPYDDVYLYNGNFTGYNSSGEHNEDFHENISMRVYETLGGQRLSINIDSSIYNFLSEKSGSSFNTQITFYFSNNNYRIATYLLTNIDGNYYLSTQKVDKITTTGDLDVNATTHSFLLTKQNDNSLTFDGSISNKITQVYINNAYATYFHNTENTNDFYKHFVIDSWNEEIINLGNKNGQNRIYKYTINLCSETKKLEVIQVSEYSITQPQSTEYFENGGKKKSVYECMCEVIDMYSPVIKIATSGDTWKYEKKYSISNQVKEKFSNVYSPDFTLNNPNLRDILSKLMIVQDCIPVVKDDVIYYLDITERHGEFNLDENVNYISGALNSQGYCETLKTSYSGAISQDNACRMVEYMGFRNSGSGLLTLDNLTLETKYPIYKIGKIYMYYYKKCKIREIGQDNITSEGGEIVILCKQDITKLVRLESERSLLSQNWYTLERGEQPSTIDDMAKFKYCTFGYNIGSNKITGWGDKYTYFNYTWWQKDKTVIENVLRRMDKLYPWGINNGDYYRSKLGLKSNQKLVVNANYLGEEEEQYDFFDGYVNPFAENTTTIGDYLNAIGVLTNKSMGLKGIFFSVEYSAFFDGVIYHGKDIDRDFVVSNDNQSSSLTILEEHGVAQIEKANRLGNITYKIVARYNSLSQLQPLGSVLNLDEEKDIIIYHREYSILNNFVNCIYYGAKDYVLKNYYTSVYAKHRPYNLLGYGESTKRNENKKMYVVLSKNACYFENLNSAKFNFLADNQNSVLLSCLKPTFYNANEKKLEFPDKIDYGYIEHNGEKYASDVNVFASGNSLCFNISMYDNISMGLGLDKNYLVPMSISPIFNSNSYLSNIQNSVTLTSLTSITDNSKTNSLVSFSNVVDFVIKYIKNQGDLIATVGEDGENLYITGSQQKWYKVIDSDYTGYTDKMGFYVGQVFKETTDSQSLPDAFGDSNAENEAIKTLKDKVFVLPKIESENIMKNILGGEYEIHKDNKEQINMTFQIELYNDSKEYIFFSPWVFKLNDLLGAYNKIEKPTEISVPFYYTDAKNGEFYISTFGSIKNAKNTAELQDNSSDPQYIPVIIFKIKKQDFETIINWCGIDEMVSTTFSLDWKNEIYGLFDNKIQIGDVVKYHLFGKTLCSYANDENYKYVAFQCEQIIKKLKWVNRDLEDNPIGPPKVYEEIVEDTTLQLIYSKTLTEYYCENDESEEEYLIFTNLTDVDGNTNIDPKTILFYQNGEKYIKPSHFHAKNNTDVLQVNYTFNSYDEPVDDSNAVLNWYCYLETVMHDQIGGNVSSYRKKCYLDKLDDRLLSYMEEKDATFVTKSNLKTTKELEKNLYVLKSNKTIDNTISYHQYKTLEELNSSLSTTDTNKKISDIIYVTSDYADNDDKPYIYISLKNIPTTTNSIQVWYWDNFDQLGNFERDEETEQITAENFKKGDQYFHFVFGVNLKHKEDGSFDESIDEQGNPCVKIYLSLLSSKDKRVFDIYHNEIGKVENYLDSDKPYGKGQYYKKNS